MFIRSMFSYLIHDISNSITVLYLQWSDHPNIQSEIKQLDHIVRQLTYYPSILDELMLVYNAIIFNLPEAANDIHRLQTVIHTYRCIYTFEQCNAYTAQQLLQAICLVAFQYKDNMYTVYADAVIVNAVTEHLQHVVASYNAMPNISQPLVLNIHDHSVRMALITV
jgi:hypothetical protein